MGMGSGLSIASHAEIVTKYAKAYVKASKKDKGRTLDQVIVVTGRSRDNARRRLVTAAKRPPGAGPTGREPAGTARGLALVRRPAGRAADVGYQRWAVREVARRLDAHQLDALERPRRAPRWR